MPGAELTHTADGKATLDGLPSWVIEAARSGMPETTSDNVQKQPVAVTEADPGMPPVVLDPRAWYTPETIAAMIGVQPQRIRQIVRKLRIGQKLGRQWLLTADDLRKLLADRQPKEPTTMSARKTAQIVALEGLAHIATRIDRAEKAHEEDRQEAWRLSKQVTAMEDRLNELDRRLLQLYEPKAGVKKRL